MNTYVQQEQYYESFFMDIAVEQGLSWDILLARDESVVNRLWAEGYSIEQAEQYLKELPPQQPDDEEYNET